VGDVKKIASRSATEIGLAFRNGETNPVALTEYLLERIGNASGSNIFITVMIERALREAEASAKRHAEGRPASPLDGVPVAWKDLFDVAGSRTTAGSLLYRDAPIVKQDQPCVANAAAAGMVCMGKLNLTEFAYSGLGINPHFGTPVNPNDAKVHRSPGGSSSGSGAAVAAGLVPCAIGSDTGGSVRIPSSLNGTYGYKTSEGRIDKTGMVPLSRTLDTIGPLARSVEDCINIDMAMRGAATNGVKRRDLKTLKIVVPENIVFDSCDSAVVDNFETSIAALEDAGASVARKQIDTFNEVMELTSQHGSLVAAEAFHEYGTLLDSEDGKKIDDRVVHRIVEGGKMSANDLLHVLNTRRQAMTKMAVDFGDVLIAMPTTPITAPKIAPLEADVDRYHKVNLLVLRNTMIGNFLGFCGLTIPNGRDHNGLPTSILFSGPLGQDDILLDHGLEIGRVLQDLFSPTWTAQ